MKPFPDSHMLLQYSSCGFGSMFDIQSRSLHIVQIEEMEQKYGGHLIARRAARRIQTAFRQYQLSKNFQKIRNSLSESKLPRRISLRQPSPSGRNRNATQRHSYSLHPGGGQIPLRSKTPPPPPCRSTSLPPSPASAPPPVASPAPSPVPPQSPGPSLTQLEDCFSEQVSGLTSNRAPIS